MERDVNYNIYNDSITFITILYTEIKDNEYRSKIKVIERSKDLNVINCIF